MTTINYRVARARLAGMTADPAMLEAFDAAVAEIKSGKYGSDAGPAQSGFIDAVIERGLSLDAIFRVEDAA